jgi:DNA polymerase I-like protein with 3'-5' exonuclease and polymerase domains
MFPSASMEYVGIGFEQSTFQSQIALIQRKLKSLEARAYSIVGHPFEITDPGEVSSVLFEEMKIPYPHSPKK